MEIFLEKLISDSTDVLSMIRKRVYVKTDAKKDYKNEPLKKLSLEFATTHGINAILGIIYMLDVFKMVLSKKISKAESKKFYIKIFWDRVLIENDKIDDDDKKILDEITNVCDRFHHTARQFEKQTESFEKLSKNSTIDRS